MKPGLLSQEVGSAAACCLPIVNDLLLATPSTTSLQHFGDFFGRSIATLVKINK